ncbi:MAG TPA: glycosyl hydrolase family 28 protein [Cellvibrio sp.]|nr:glycosyl hydrolase family 28 protein [Cellvibrio sp.]
MSSSLSALASSSSTATSSSSKSSSSAIVTGIQVSLDKTDLLVGETTTVTVLDLYSDGHKEPAKDVFWFNTQGIIKIENRTITALKAGVVQLGSDAQVGGGRVVTGNTVTIRVTDPQLVVRTLYLTATNTSPLVPGAARSLALSADYDTATRVALDPAIARYTSSDSQVATVINGIVTANSVGKVTITASYDGKSASYDMEVVPAGVSFHILKPASWNTELYAHWFMQKDLFVENPRFSTFPGTAMQDADGDGWYDINIPALTEISVLFSDGGSASAGFHQTADQWSRRGGWFVPDDFPRADGKYYGTWYDEKPELVDQPVCDVKNYGAKGDGVSKDTVAIQKAIDDCAGRNGIVRLRNGKFLSGTIVLKSDMTLRIEPSATLLGVRSAGDYPTQPKLSNNSQYLNCRQAFIYAEKASNIRIDGGGTIDGNGGNGSPWMSGLEATRPMAVFLVQSENIVIQNITIKNSAMWTLVPFESSNILIRGVTISSLEGSNRDGIDPVDCHNVLIEDVTISSQDDAICLKSGSSRGTQDVLVRNSKVLKSIVANGLKFGTATVGPFKNIRFENIDLEDVKRGGIAVESVDGSAVSDVAYRNIRMTKVGTPFYIVLGDRSSNRTTATPRVGSIDNITFENILAVSNARGIGIVKTWGSYMSGIAIAGKTFDLTNLTFTNVELTFPGGSTNYGAQPEYAGEYPDPGPPKDDIVEPDMPGYLFFRHVDKLTMNNVKVSVSQKDSRPLIVKEDVTNVTAD